METERKKLKKEKQQKQMEEWKQYRQDFGWPVQQWRAWGSWFSWGSPVGLGLFIALTMISIGIFIWLINL